MSPASQTAVAGFAIHIDHESVIEENARERFSLTYGDPDDRRAAFSAGFIDANGEISPRGWEILNKDIQALETNSLAYLKRKFVSAVDHGHSTDGALVGNVWFDPTNIEQAELIILAHEGNERLDMNDESYGDLARYAWDGVSDFGLSVLGGSITFFTVDRLVMNELERTDRYSKCQLTTLDRVVESGGMPLTIALAIQEVDERASHVEYRAAGNGAYIIVDGVDDRVGEMLERLGFESTPIRKGTYYALFVHR